jgi:hypothetical protein
MPSKRDYFLFSNWGRTPKTTPVYQCVCGLDFSDTSSYNKHISYCVEAELFRTPLNERYTPRQREE